jgi:Ca-activated chloride channel family protein
VAEISNGKFFKGQDTSAVQDVFKEIDQLEKTKLVVRHLKEVTELFPYPAAAALITALFALVFWQTLGRRLPA